MGIKVQWLLMCCCHFLIDSNANSPLHEKGITIIIPSYNNASWYQYNLESVLQQEYENYRAIYLDDASEDNTGALVKEYLAKNDSAHRVQFIQNKQRSGALANIYAAVWMCAPSEIIITLDGDDWLAHDCVLKKINEVYSNSDVWMTYGQYISYPDDGGYGAQALPQWVIENASYRSYDWVTTHLRTFYAGLFQNIKKEDLLYEDKFFSVAWDLGFMFPLLEMSAAHCRYIPEVLYVYNTANPLNDNKHHKELQLMLEKFIRKKQKYSPVEKLL